MNVVHLILTRKGSMAISDFFNRNVESIISYVPGKPIEGTARELNISPIDIVKLASNECPLGVSPLALKAITESMHTMNLYPDGEALLLKKKLALRYGIDYQRIIVGNGSDEILKDICLSFSGANCSIVMSKYSFLNYKIYPKMFGYEIIEVPAKGLSHDLIAMAEAIKESTRIIFVCNPNNPTGTFVEEQEIIDFMKKVPEDVLVVFDEAYAEITLKQMPDTLSFVKENRNVIVLRSFSKSYGLAGLRVGVGITTMEIAKFMGKARLPFNCNRMAQLAAVAALDDEEFVQRSKTVYKKGRAQLIKACEELKLKYEYPYANFILIKVGKGKVVTELLLKRGIIVRPVDAYELSEYIRVSIGTEEENEKFIVALKEIKREG